MQEASIELCVGWRSIWNTVWHCPWCNSLFCQIINVMMYSFSSQQPPDAEESIIRFADKKVVNVCLLLAAWFVYSVLWTKESWKPFVQFRASCKQLLGVLWLCWAQIFRNQNLAPQSVFFLSSLPFLICFQDLPVESAMMAGHSGCLKSQWLS